MLLSTRSSFFNHNEVVIEDTEDVIIRESEAGTEELTQGIAYIMLSGIATTLSTGEKELLGYALADKLKELLQHRVDGEIKVLKTR